MNPTPISQAKTIHFTQDQRKLISGAGRRIKKLLFTAFFALICSGVALVLLPSVLRDLYWFEACFFLGPFILAGIGLWIYCGYLILKLLNPTTLINVGNRAAYAGTELNFEWRINGKASRLTKLQIRFEGRESIKYINGSSTTSKETWVFMVIPVFESEKVEEFESGQAMVDLSRVTMPTFNSSHNSIKYYLCVKGEIPNWPDIDDEFEIDIWPSTAKEEQS